MACSPLSVNGAAANQHLHIIILSGDNGLRAPLRKTFERKNSMRIFHSQDDFFSLKRNESGKFSSAFENFTRA